MFRFVVFLRAGVHKEQTELWITLLGLALLVPCPADAGPFAFTNITISAGITHTHYHQADIHPYGYSGQVSYMSGGAVAEDFDGDGWLDLYVLQGGASANLLYMNQGGSGFTNEAALRGADFTHYGMGVAAADYDNDGDVDILLVDRTAPGLLENDGSGTFSAVTNVLGPVTYANAMSPSWGDIDNDGLLDLAVGDWETGGQRLHVYRNTGPALIPVEFRKAPYMDQRMYSPRFADLNNDRRVDLPAVGDFLHSQLYLNPGTGSFLRVTTDAGVGIEENGMGSAIGDNDGDLDWFASSIYGVSDDPAFWPIGNRLYRNRGNGSFVDVTESAGVKNGNWGWGSAFGDLDNDGDLDLYHVNGWPDRAFPSTTYQFVNAPARLFENLGDGSFTNVAATSGADNTGQGRGVILFDLDNDGDLDIFICNNMDVTLRPDPLPPLYYPGTPALLRNDSATSNHWLRVTLDGVPPLHRDGIGSRVYVTAGTNTQFRELHASTGFLSQGPGRIAYFGLGTNTVADEVRAEWNSGDAVIRYEIAADQALELPSAQATLSDRILVPGQSVTASAAAYTNPVDWVVGGVTNADPVVATFTNSGTHELVLNVYESGSSVLVSREILRVEVLDFAPITSIVAASSGDVTVGWGAVSGALYRVESNPDLVGGTWTDGTLPCVTTTSGVESAVFTNLPGLVNHYRVVKDPTFPWPDPE